jgi:hypothetical protein
VRRVAAGVVRVRGRGKPRPYNCFVVRVTVDLGAGRVGLVGRVRVGRGGRGWR